VRQPPDHGVTRRSLTAAAPTPLVCCDDPAGQHRTLRLQPLPGDFETELVEPAERGQVRASESSAGSVRHVEVFRMGSVRTSILGRPRPLSAHRRAEPAYTLICEEPGTLQVNAFFRNKNVAFRGCEFRHSRLVGDGLIAVSHGALLGAQATFSGAIRW
jgi:hypothetical protein